MSDQIPEIEADIERLEHALRRLNIEYGRFFAGTLPKPPDDLRFQVKKLIKRYMDAPIRKYAVRYQFNSLVSRYNILSERWAKATRDQEEGPRRPARRVATADNLVATCKIRDAEADEAVLRVLHSRFMAARRQIGDSKSSLSYEKFASTVARQAGTLREKAGCEHVEFRVIIEGGTVRMKARPGR